MREPSTKTRHYVAPLVAVLTIAGVTVFLFWPLFSGAASYFEWDVPEQYWPDLVFLCDSLHGGELPYWNPYDRGGYPYHADPQAGSWHPMNWAICAAGGPSPGLAWATARVVVGFFLAGVFGLLWLRRIGASWAGAIAGATLIEAAPFMRHNWELNLTSALAYLPLMLWAADRLATERKLVDGVLLAFAVALCGWVGSPPALWLASSLTALYLLFRLGTATRGQRAADTLRQVAPPLALAAALTYGLLSVQVLPALELAAHSVQAGRDFESIAAGALDTEALGALLRPLSGNHLYVGLLALALTPLSLRRFDRHDRLGAFFIAVAIVAVLMSTGGRLFHAAFDLVPFVDRFRLPHRYEAWLGPAAGAIVALGLGETRSLRPVKVAPDTWKTWRRRVALLSALTGVALLAALDELGPGALALAVAAMALAPDLPVRLEPAVGLAIAALILVDITQAMPPERHMRGGTPPADEPAARAIIEHAPDTAERYRVFDEFAISCRVGARLHRRDLRGYQDPLLLSSYERVVAALREHPEVAAQFNVRYALQGPHFIHGWNRHYLPPPDELAGRTVHHTVHGTAERTVTELPGTLPFAYFVPAADVERAADRQTALARTIELAPSAIAIVEGAGEGRARADIRPSASATTLRLRPDELAFAIDAPVDGVVVVNEAYYPGWIAEVDGRPVAIHRANGFVRAVEVDAGSHVIAMRFAPDGASAGRVRLALSWLVGLSVFLWAGWPRRRTRKP